MSKKRQEIYLIAYNIRSLFNVGALFRTADVFGVTKVYLTGYTGAPPRREIAKVALGAETWIAWEKKFQTAAVVKDLQRQGVQVLALEISKHSKALPKFKPRFPVALLVGNEVTGLPKRLLDLVDAAVEIPMLGKKESLNVAVAAGIALYALRN